MKICIKKALMPFALTLLITSLLLVNANEFISAELSPEEPIYLHGPSLTPIHMHSNDSLEPIHMNSNMTLTPVHMHFVGPPEWDPIYEPYGTPWHELYPEFCQERNLTSWIDYNGDGILSPNDQIDMTDEAGNVTWYHVDRITWTVLLSNTVDPEEFMFVEFKGPPEVEDPIGYPICTYWHEVYPTYSNVYHIVDATGPLEWCTYILIENVTGGGELSEWHVEDVATDLILREKITDPVCTWWHEIYPEYCKWWHLTSWEDNGDEMLSPCDQIDMIDEETGNKTWYHVDRITTALNVTLEKEPTEWMKIELKTYYFEEMYNALKHPVDTLWHEVYPDYSNLYILTWWDWWEDDNCNGVLDVCDYIWLYNSQTGEEYRYHVEDICYDIILNKKIMDPRCTWWHEVARAPYSLEPPFNLHHLTSWQENIEDPYPGRLSPCDQIDMYNELSGETKWYHVDRVTLTLNVSIIFEPGIYYLFEYKGPFENIYWVKIDPIESLWHLVWPYYEFNPPGYPITAWEDNCNGVLDSCDNVTIGGTPCHVEDLAIDIILNEKITDPVCTDWHELYPEYCNWYHVEGWTDNGDNLLSPCDSVDLALLPTGPTEKYHVEYVTLTINITDPYEPGWWILLEYYYEGPVETMYWVKTHPIGSWWYEPGWIGAEHQIQNWTDNCNGVLDYCDEVMFYDYWYHVEGVSIDMVVAPPPIHDVAVTKVASLKDWVYQGQIDPISVTITNYGDYDEPTVDVYAFYDGTLAAPKQTTSLLIGETKTLTFNWDTTGVPPGFYTVSANATIPIDDVPGNNYLVGNVQEVRELPPPPEDLELYPREVVDLEIPFGTQWHELHPSKTNYYQLTDWLPGAVLGPEDFVLMDGWEFLVDDLTIDIEVLDIASGTTYWLDYECGYWTFNPEDPVCTKWNEIKNSETHAPPEWPRCWHLTEWYDNGDGRLSYCDDIMMIPNDPYPGAPHLFHVELVTVTLKLTATDNQQHYLEFMGTLEEFEAMDYIHFPWETMWVEIWPEQGRPWILMDWADQPFLAPSDQIILTLKDPRTHEPIPSIWAEYHVDKVTVAMNLTNMIDGMMHIVKFEGSLVQFKYHYWMYDPPYSEGPYGTQWHEVNPTYCRQWHLLSWDDNGNYMLDFCDYILMVDKETGEEVWFHVESLSTDMYVTLTGHDVAVTNITTIRTVMAEGYKCKIFNATIENQGYYLETFNVAAYADALVIETKTVVNLPPGASITLTFVWNTTGVPKQYYTLKVVADTVPGETETGDNTLTDGQIRVVIPGNVNGDGIVNMVDIYTELILRFMCKTGDLCYSANSDINCDGIINMIDIYTAILHFMETEP